MLNLPCTVDTLLRSHQMTIDLFPMSREINGFLYKRKHIAINKNIDWYEKRFTVCHELSHMILGHTCEDKYCEREADQNAFEMLVSDSELLEELEKYQGDTMILEKVLGIPAWRIQKRLEKFYF